MRLEKSKNNQIAEIFNAFPPGANISAAKVARQCHASIETVINFVTMNQGIVNRDGDKITLLAKGSTSRTGNNTREFGTVATTFRSDLRRVKGKTHPEQVSANKLSNSG